MNRRAPIPAVLLINKASVMCCMNNWEANIPKKLLKTTQTLQVASDEYKQTHNENSHYLSGYKWGQGFMSGLRARIYTSGDKDLKIRTRI